MATATAAVLALLALVGACGAVTITPRECAAAGGLAFVDGTVPDHRCFLQRRQSVTYDDHVAFCEGLGAAWGPATLRNDKEVDAAVRMVSGAGVWLGAEIETQGELPTTWYDGSPFLVGSRFRLSTEPNDDLPAAVMILADELFDDPTSTGRYSLCAADILVEPEHYLESCNDTVVQNNGGRDLYCARAFTDTPLAGPAAAAACASLGPAWALATVSDTSVSSALYTLVGEATHLIGFNDVFQEGYYRWRNGFFRGGFFAFLSGEPNNEGNEDWITANGASGSWNDVPATRTYPYACTANLRQPTLTPDECTSDGGTRVGCRCLRVLDTDRTYSDSVTACAALGPEWSLGVPRTPEENDFVGTATRTWIGTDDRQREGQYTRIDGSSGYRLDGAYLNFADGEPNGSGDCIYVALSTKWDDIPCDRDAHALCTAPVEETEGVPENPCAPCPRLTTTSVVGGTLDCRGSLPCRLECDAGYQPLLPSCDANLGASDDYRPAPSGSNVTGCYSAPAIDSLEPRASASLVVRFSQPFMAAGERWNVVAVPAGAEDEPSRHVEASVERPDGDSATESWAVAMRNLEAGAEYAVEVRHVLPDAAQDAGFGGGDRSDTGAVTLPCGCFDTGDGTPLVQDLELADASAAGGGPAVRLTATVRETSLCRSSVNPSLNRYRVHFFTDIPGPLNAAPLVPCPAEAAWNETAPGGVATAGAGGCATRRCPPGGRHWLGVDDSACPEGERLGESSQLPARTCADMARQRPSNENEAALRWIRPAAGGAPVEAVCMTRDGLMRAAVSDGAATAATLRALVSGTPGADALEFVIAAADAASGDGAGYPRFGYRLRNLTSVADEVLAPWLAAPPAGTGASFFVDAAASSARPSAPVAVELDDGEGLRTVAGERPWVTATDGAQPGLGEFARTGTASTPARLQAGEGDAPVDGLERWVREAYAPLAAEELAEPLAAVDVPARGAYIDDLSPSQPIGTCGAQRDIGLFDFTEDLFSGGGGRFNAPLELGERYYACVMLNRDSGEPDLAPATCRSVVLPFRGRLVYRVVPADSDSADAHVPCVLVTVRVNATGELLAQGYTRSSTGLCTLPGGDASVASAQEPLRLGEVQLDFSLAVLPAGLASPTELPVAVEFERVDVLSNGTLLPHQFEFEPGADPATVTSATVSHMAAASSVSVTDLAVQGVSGRLTFAGTSALAGGEACPVAGARVCASIDNALECLALENPPPLCKCASTGDDGTYNIALPTGAVAYMQVQHRDGVYRGARESYEADESDFEPTPGGEAARQESDDGLSPWVFVAQAPITDVDYELVSTEALSVMVRGGGAACNGGHGCGLGRATVRARSPLHCPAYEREVQIGGSTCDGDCAERDAVNFQLYSVRSPPFERLEVLFDNVDPADTSLVQAAEAVRSYITARNELSVVVPQVEPAGTEGALGTPGRPVLYEFHQGAEVSLGVPAVGASACSSETPDGDFFKLLQNQRYQTVLTAVEKFTPTCECPVNGYVEVIDVVTAGASVSAPAEPVLTTEETADRVANYRLERVENGAFRWDTLPRRPNGAVLPSTPLESHLWETTVRLQPDARLDPAASPTGWQTTQLRVFVEGVYTPSVANVLELPQADGNRVAWAWLRRPPGDRSFTSVTRGVEQSTALGVGSSEGSLRTTNVNAAVGASVGVQTCAGGFVGAGAGVGAFTVAGGYSGACTTTARFEARAFTDSDWADGVQRDTDTESVLSSTFSDGLTSARGAGSVGADGDTALLPTLTYVVAKSYQVSLNDSCSVLRPPSPTIGVSTEDMMQTATIKSQYTVCTRDVFDACARVAQLEGWGDDVARVAAEFNLTQCLPYDVSGIGGWPEHKRRNTPSRASTPECTHHALACRPGCEADGDCPTQWTESPLGTEDVSLADLDALEASWTFPEATEFEGYDELTPAEQRTYQESRRSSRRAVLGWLRLLRSNCDGKRLARPQRGLFSSFADEALSAVLDSAGTASLDLTDPGVLDTAAGELNDRLEGGADDVSEEDLERLGTSLLSGALQSYDPGSGRAVLSIEGGGVAFEREATFSRSETTSSTVEFTAEQLVEAGVFAEGELTGVVGAGGTSVTMEWGSSRSAMRAAERTVSTTTTFHLEDSSLGDQFLVEVMADPIHGSPVFYTRGGRSLCPHEPGTDAREGARLLVEGEPTLRNVPFDQPAVFDMQLTNESPTEESLSYAFGLLSTSNRNSAQVFADGDGFGGEQVLPVMEYGTAPLVRQLAVSPNYRRSTNYEDLLVEMYSKCERDLYLAGQLTAHYIASQALITATFVFPCAELRWEGAIAEDSGFLANGESGGKVRVAAGNPAWSVRRWSDTERLEWVRLEYRRAGEPAWDGLYALADDDAPDAVAHNLDDSGSPIAGFFWDLERQGIEDGEYQVRLRAQCTPGSERADLDVSFSDAVTGFVDRVAPRVFGLPEPADREYLPGASDEISLEMDEDVECNGDWAAAVTLIDTDESCDDTAALLRGDALAEGDVLSICNGGRIRFRFAAATVPLTRTNGRQACVTVAGLRDLRGNAAGDVSWSFDVPALRLDRVGVVVSGIEIGGLAPAEINPDDLVDELALLAGVDAARVRVVAIEARAGGGSTVTIRILTPASASDKVALRRERGHAPRVLSDDVTPSAAAEALLAASANAGAVLDPAQYPLASQLEAAGDDTGIGFDLDSDDGGVSPLAVAAVPVEAASLSLGPELSDRGTFEVTAGATLATTLASPLFLESPVASVTCRAVLQSTRFAGAWPDEPDDASLEDVEPNAAGEVSLELAIPASAENGRIWVRGVTVCRDGSQPAVTKTTGAVQGYVGETIEARSSSSDDGGGAATLSLAVLLALAVVALLVLGVVYHRLRGQRAGDSSTLKNSASTSSAEAMMSQPSMNETTGLSANAPAEGASVEEDANAGEAAPVGVDGGAGPEIELV